MFRGARLGRLCLAASAVLLAAACSSSKDGGSATEKIPAPAIPAVLTEPADGAEVALPLDGYGISSGDSLLFVQAREQATRTCMQAKGFDYTPAAAGQKPPPAPIDSERLGILSLTAAKQTGYHRPPPAAGGGSVPTAEGRPNESPEYGKALNGDMRPGGPTNGTTADRGCHAAMDRQLADAKIPEAKSDLVGDLRAQAHGLTGEDTRVRAALDAWSSCMKGLGYQYQTPVDASAAAWPDPVGQKERDTATADMGCKTQAKLLATWYAVEEGYQKALIARNESGLQAVKDAAAQRMAVVKKALGGG
ncbi:hypothetical protein J5Y04_04170 [Kitasatospora sp. RG8]|uniref:hypothetical protein n=1 Tax=Kitasatospora sp. RG8 TaxID=2820815 RepID=UPI001AE04061|nr:hypothetical protein [Kitasatospora sp. RG8]MBP0448739.1 hypothetical protein [Kitasatospora sp. RG8]